LNVPEFLPELRRSGPRQSLQKKMRRLLACCQEQPARVADENECEPVQS